MIRPRLLINLLAVSVVAASHAQAQLKAPISFLSEPFSVERGSTFSASGGATGRSSAGSELQRLRITSEIREAQAIISRNYISGNILDTPELTKDAVEGMLRSLDPHSNFFDKAEWSDLLDEQRSGYTGIGATISNFDRSGLTDTFILSTFPGSPAARGQLRFGDRIVAVDGESMSGKSSEVVRDKIRGQNGSLFKLTVERLLTNKIETLAIRRNRVSVPSISDAYMLDHATGYIDITEGFNFTTSHEFNAAIEQLKRSGMRSLVIDLRGNGGGIVDQAVKVAERFLPTGTLILTQKGRSINDDRVWRSTNLAPEKMPLVVLVDQDTASASEIVAGAFQDNDRALIVGEKTFGKGLVQTVLDLPGSTGLTLTTARYLTPSGRSIQRDYSKGDLYDYFNHVTPAAGIDIPYFEARTVTNRKVFGGDGINPDEVLESEKITPAQVLLLDPLFLFARQVVKGSIPGHEAYRSEKVSFGHRVLAREMTISDALMDAFYDFAAKQSRGRVSVHELAGQAAFIKVRLRYNIVMASFGAAAAKQVLIANDLEVAKAIAAIPRASQLNNIAAAKRRR